MMYSICKVARWISAPNFWRPVWASTSRSNRAKALRAEEIVKESAAGNSFVQHAHRPLTGLRQ